MAKTALVTGGAKRIGAAITRDLAAHGFNVAFQYTNSEDQAHDLAIELGQYGNKIIQLEADLLEPQSAKELFANATAAIGPIDLLVNNASIFEPDEADKFNEALWEQHFAIHLKTPTILSSQLVQQGDLESGLIVNIIDQRVLRPNPNFFSYTLSKSALWNATQTMAQAFAPNIRVNAIGPGPTLANERQAQEDFQKQIDGLILKRGPQLDEFGKTIRYLYETPSITGQMIALDGGQHLAWETPDIVGINE